jgi:hypothetical protein
MKRSVLAISAFVLLALPACVTTSSTHATDAAAAAAAMKVAGNAKTRPVDLQQLNLGPARTGTYDPAKDPTVRSCSGCSPRS